MRELVSLLTTTSSSWASEGGSGSLPDVIHYLTLICPSLPVVSASGALSRCITLPALTFVLSKALILPCNPVFLRVTVFDPSMSNFRCFLFPAGAATVCGMDVEEVHFIPKVFTTSTTPELASTPASRFPSVLTSLYIPPAHLDEILPPKAPPKVTHQPSLLQPPQQKYPAPQHSTEVKENDQSAPQLPLEEYPREHNAIEVKGNDYKTVWHQNTSLLNAAPQNVSQKLKRLKMDSQEGSGGDEEGRSTSRWRFGWWNEEPSDVQQLREEAGSGPRFDRTLARKVTVQEGRTAVLGCRVVDNTDKAVRLLCVFLTRV